MGQFIAILTTLISSRALAASNVYGEELAKCGSAVGKSSGGYCAFVGTATDPEAHHICVPELPQNISQKTAGSSWSDGVTGTAWCIPVWVYANFVLGGNTLSVKCEAIDAKTLNLRNALRHWKQCGLKKTVCNDFLRAVTTLCDECQQAAKTKAARDSLHQSCRTMEEAMTLATKHWMKDVGVSNVLFAGSALILPVAFLCLTRFCRRVRTEDAEKQSAINDPISEPLQWISGVHGSEHEQVDTPYGRFS